MTYGKDNHYFRDVIMAYNVTVYLKDSIIALVTREKFVKVSRPVNEKYAVYICTMKGGKWKEAIFR